ncbi:family 43 glycosylhydrolase, partial [bacterium]|nr:family 43 glycosylhydrolase [bacterium]
TDPVLCTKTEQEWENPNSMDTRCNEGPFILKHSGTYYMTYSANHYRHPFYGIGYATANSPMGPWEKSRDNPLVAQNPEIDVAGPGHNSITTSPDGEELFMVYHTHADAKKMRGRVLNIDRLIFDKMGKLKLIGPTRSPQPLPSGAN